MKKRFRNSVVPTVSFPTHTLDAVVIVQSVSKGVTGILNTPVRMNQKSFPRFTPPESPEKCVQYKSVMQCVAQLPADNHPREKINKNDQIHPPIVNLKIRDIRYPGNARPADRKLPIQNIRRNRKIMFRVRCYPEFFPDAGAKSVFAHKTLDPSRAHRPTLFAQIPSYFRAAGTFLTFRKQRSNPKFHPKLFHRPLTPRTPAPRVETTPRHLKDPAHLLDAPQRAVLGYEREYRFGSTEKMATAFFKMSRSRLRRSFSRWSCRMAASCGLRGLLRELPIAPSDDNSFFQTEIAPGQSPRSRSTDACVLPSSCDNRNASCRKAVSYFNTFFMNTPPLKKIIWGKSVSTKSCYYQIAGGRVFGRQARDTVNLDFPIRGTWNRVDVLATVHCKVRERRVCR